MPQDKNPQVNCKYAAKGTNRGLICASQRTKVQSGRYTDACDVVRDALRALGVEEQWGRI